MSTAPNSGDLPRGINLRWLWRNVATIIAILTLFAGAVTTWNRVDAHEQRIAEQDRRHEATQKKIARLSHAIGVIQLDLAQLCAAQFGAEKCYTSGKRQLPAVEDE